jgi:hypothetical protein
MKVHYQSGLDSLKRGTKTAEDRMARAATKSMRELAKLVEKNGRAEIARGIGARNARSFFARAKPRVGYSINTSMRGYLHIGYLNIFERGQTIRPKSGLFWIPLSNAPQKVGRKRITPKLYEQHIGPLFRVERAGKAPLLFGEIAGGAATGKLTAGRLRTGAKKGETRRNTGKGRRTVRVPVFVGISAAKMPDRLNVDAVYRRAGAELPRLYAQQMLATENSSGT